MAQIAKGRAKNEDGHPERSEGSAVQLRDIKADPSLRSG